MGETVDLLRDSDPGRWQVTTAASIYVLDLNRRTVVRLPGTGALVQGHGFHVSRLERDNETMVLDKVKICLRGWSMILYTDPRPDSTDYRVSTPVVEIRRLPDTTEHPRAARRHEPENES